VTVQDPDAVRSALLEARNPIREAAVTPAPAKKAPAKKAPAKKAPATKATASTTSGPRARRSAHSPATAG
jgi:hypothetical protein